LAEPLVLVTRPEPGGAETAARVEALGLRALLAPALVLTPLAHPPLPPAQALLLPSRAAVRAVEPSGIRVLGVGEATAEAARARGFSRVEAAEGDAVSLVAHCRAHLRPEDGPLLLAVGAGYSLELATALRQAGFRVVRRVVYAAAEAPTLPPDAVSALDGRMVTHALFFSPRSARCILDLMASHGLGGAARGIVAIAISPRVAAALSDLSWRDILTAPRPHQDQMLELLPPP
jgi:uroporphyrinogen-III synthase